MQFSFQCPLLTSALSIEVSESSRSSTLVGYRPLCLSTIQVKHILVRSFELVHLRIFNYRGKF